LMAAGAANFTTACNKNQLEAGNNKQINKIYPDE